MTYAIIETGGKQFRVEPGRFYDIELLHVEAESQVIIDKVFLIQHEDDVHIGQPLVENATVEGTVLRHFRGRKLGRKKDTAKKQLGL
jgi:large subunit ribosomal protein L21